MINSSHILFNQNSSKEFQSWEGCHSRGKQWQDGDSEPRRDGYGIVVFTTGLLYRSPVQDTAVLPS